MPRAIIIGEALSRHGERDAVEAGKELRARGLEIVEAHFESGHRAVQKRVRGSIKSGAELIVVCGGDGTLAHAVAELATTNVVLGVVPAGTGNSFAHSLGITSLEQAFDAIARGRCVNVDVGMVNERYFANFATVGLAAEIAQRTPRWLKHALGAVAYGVAAVRPILLGASFRSEVRWKKNRLDLRTRQIIVVSGRDFGHTAVTPESSVKSGKLTFFATEERSAVDVFEFYSAFLAGRQMELPHTHYFQAKKISIKTSPRMLIAIDGEPVCKTPATFRVVPGALRVMVPASFEAGT